VAEVAAVWERRSVGEMGWRRYRAGFVFRMSFLLGAHREPCSGSVCHLHAASPPAGYSLHNTQSNLSPVRINRASRMDVTVGVRADGGIILPE
jgi:hypothetical protein